MKKIIIITVTAGEGHNSVAKALKQKFESFGDVEVKVIDLFKEFGSKFKVFFLDDAFRTAVKFLPSVYNMIYSMVGKEKPENREKCSAQITVENETPKLFKTILDYQPDFIICTHFYGAMAISNLRKIYNLQTKTASILTDYGIPPFLQATIGIDYLFVTSESLEKGLLDIGFKKEQLVYTGLPVKPQFETVGNKVAARKELGLELDKFTILVMMGGGGAAGILKIYKKLLKVNVPTHIVIVNGKDKGSFKAVEELNEMLDEDSIHTVTNLGFVNNIDKYMDACDCIVGKCGGISCTESINKEIPLIVATYLLSQEIDNYVYLENNQAVLYADKEQKLNKIIEMIIKYPMILEGIKANLQRIKRPNALNDICNFMMQFSAPSYEDLIKEYSTPSYEIKNKIKKAKSKIIKQQKEKKSEIIKIKTLRKKVYKEKAKEKEQQIKKLVKGKEIITKRKLKRD